MLNGTPCVILEGSGRIADVIAEVAGLPVGDVTISLIRHLMKRFFGQEYESFTHLKIIEWTKKVCEPQTKPTVFSIDRFPFIKQLVKKKRKISTLNTSFPLSSPFNITGLTNQPTFYFKETSRYFSLTKLIKDKN